MMRKTLLKRLGAVALSFAMVAGLVACGGGNNNAGTTASTSSKSETKTESESQSEPEDTGIPTDISADLMLYTSEPEELVSEMIAKFNETYPNVNIDLFRAGTGKVTAAMDTEFEAEGTTKANMVWFADIGYIKGLDDKGLVYHYDSPAASVVPDSYKYDDGMGIELRLIYNIIAYNTTNLSEDQFPKDWSDVTGEAFTGKFALADPNISGGAFSALVTHVKHEDKVGWKWYEDLAANDVKYEETNGNLQTKLASGEYNGVEIVDFMARTAKAEGSPVDVCYPESGSCLVPTPFAILNNIPEDQIDGAKAFLDWALSNEGQEMMVAQQYIPVNPDVAGPEGAPAAKDVKVLDFDLSFFVEKANGIREEYTAKFGGAQ